MPEPVLVVEGPSTTASPAGKNRFTLWEKPIAVFLLSLFFAGLGQVINREPWKGLGFAASAPALSILGAYAGMYRTFRGLVACVVLLIALHIWISVDAFRGARQRRSSNESQSYSFAMLGICGGLVVGVTILASTNFFARRSMNFRAFKVTSDSFCPTLCQGERFVIDIDAFRTNQPERGDVIAFDFHGLHKPYFVKRIVAMGG